MPPDPSDIIGKAYDEYADAIFRHVYLRLGNREVAKEIMQDAFVKTLLVLKKGTEIENIRAFLYRIANNLLIDHVRKKKSVSLDDMQEAGFEPSGESEEDLHVKMEGTRVAATLSMLREEDRDLIVLRFVDGMKPQEIGEMLDLAPNTVSVRIHRALKELKSHLRNA